MSKNRENGNSIESEFNKFNIFDNSVKIGHENCYQPNNGKFWCKKCVPSCIIEGWTSENSEIDEFIKDTIYNAKYDYIQNCPLFLEWVPFDRFEDIQQIGDGGFAKVYSAKCIDGKKRYGIWKKLGRRPIKVALKRLNGSQNMSADYLTEVFKLYYFCPII